MLKHKEPGQSQPKPLCNPLPPPLHLTLPSLSASLQNSATAFELKLTLYHYKETYSCNQQCHLHDNEELLPLPFIDLRAFGPLGSRPPRRLPQVNQSSVGGDVYKFEILRF